MTKDMDYEGIGPTEEQGVLLGPAHELCGTRRPTRDNGDGSAVITLEIPADGIPEDLMASVINSVWRVTIMEPMEPPKEVFGNRLALKETRNGRVAVRFAVMAGDLDARALYGRSGKGTIFEIRASANHPGHAAGMEKAQRMAILRRAAMACAEPEFETWLDAEAKRRRIAPTGRPRTATQASDHTERATGEDRATETLYRVLRIASRKEILDSAAVANACEEILRNYRRSLWSESDGRR